MAAYLIVDVDDLISRFSSRNMSVDLQELAVGLRGGAALAAGLVSVEKLRAVAVANWSTYRTQAGRPNPQFIFKAAGYDLCDVPVREALADVLIINYFSYDPDPIDELILATTSRDMLPLIRRIKRTRNTRVRMWGSEDVLQGTEFANQIIFQPLETLLGIKTNHVSVFIDFENIAISLAQNGYMLDIDRMISGFIAQARAYGSIVKMAAYAPWGTRGTLPPLVDSQGREVAEDVPSRLMLANIDPVFNLPGKNSADLRIARDVLMDASHPHSASDVYILASGDRDFSQVINSIVQSGKTVIIWGVRGSTSRQLANHPSVTLEYVEEFLNLSKYQESLAQTTSAEANDTEFLPSQWSSLVIQFDRLAKQLETQQLTVAELDRHLVQMGVVAQTERGDELIQQAISLGVLRQANNGKLSLNANHPIVEKTRVIAEAITRRVANTLMTRGWAYINYGFLLNGLAMERDITRPGMNQDDQWRSHWIDALVRERLLKRELMPHRNNPDDLVPVISLPPDIDLSEVARPPGDFLPPPLQNIADDWVHLPPNELAVRDPKAFNMAKRIVVSVEQFTSFRKFAWCPLGSLHKRLRPFDEDMAFQRAVEYLEAQGAVIVDEYRNPQSEFATKGISVLNASPLACDILAERDAFVRLLLRMYERNVVISAATVRHELEDETMDVALWMSIMETENVLNPVQGRSGQYSLFRTHHTVKMVAGDATSDKPSEA